MALVKANEKHIEKKLAETLENTPNNIDNNSSLVNFYLEVQQIEVEEKIENWIINWLNVTSDFLNKEPLHTLVESICTMLEIRSFTPPPQKQYYNIDFNRIIKIIAKIMPFNNFFSFFDIYQKSRKWYY